MNKYLVYGGLVVAIVIATVSLVKSPDTVVGRQGLQGPRGEQGVPGPVGPQGPAGRDGRDGKDGKNGQTLGGVSGPDTYYPYVANNDLQRYGLTKGFNTATTTVCAIRGPQNSTSTVSFASASFRTGSTTASRVTLAIAATAFATTTPIGAATIAANAQGTVTATTTASVDGLDDPIVVPPGYYYVVGMQGGIGTFSPVGSCSVEFIRN